MISMLARIVVLFYFCLAQPANAQLTVWPSPPINPTSATQCHALFNKYKSINTRLASKARSYNCLQQASAKDGYDYTMLNSCEALRRSSWEQASEALNRGSKARRVCLSQVQAHNADNRQNYRNVVLGEVNSKVSNRIIGVAKQEIIKTVLKESAEATAMRSAFRTMAIVQSRITGLSAHRSGNGSFFVNRGFGEFRNRLHFNPLRSLSLDLATSLNRSVYERTVRDFEVRAAQIKIDKISQTTVQRLRRTSQTASSFDTEGLTQESGLSDGDEAFRTFNEARAAAMRGAEQLREDRIKAARDAKQLRDQKLAAAAKARSRTKANAKKPMTGKRANSSRKSLCAEVDFAALRYARQLYRQLESRGGMTSQIRAQKADVERRVRNGCR